jgi:hypothetical protein
MSYRVIRDADGRPRIVLEGEPWFCRALDAAPLAREPELDRGAWLVMAFATWSMPDVAAVQTALDVARRFDGALRLGLRPFDLADEHETWCPGLASGGRNPYWILFREGEVCLTRAGHVTADALVEAIERAPRQ